MQAALLELLTKDAQSVPYAVQTLLPHNVRQVLTLETFAVREVAGEGLEFSPSRLTPPPERRREPSYPHGFPT